MLQGLWMAFGFLTVIPAGPTRLGPEESLAPARAFFPLTGLLIGAALAAADGLSRAAFSAGLAGALVLALLAVLTRALHLEGFMDSCDALFGGFTRERRLEILRDPRVGAFAVIGVALLLLLQWAALASLTGAVRTTLLLVFPVLSRWGMALVMPLFPYARAEGMGRAFHAGDRPWHTWLSLMTAAGIALLAAGPAGIVLLAVASGVAWIVARWAAGLLGGLTGDVYGAVNELSALAVLLVGASLASRAPGLFISAMDLARG